MLDPAHPKRALWMTRDDVWKPEHIPLRQPRELLAAGMLVASTEDCARLAADPTEETLAEILGYVVSKAAALAASLPHPPLVIQARDPHDCVVLEMLAGPGQVREAARRCAEYGRVALMTMEACLKRRQRLIGQETRHAKG